MKKSELYDESHSATYCPEDDKIRLYVGRVPRDEYLALKAEGWTSTPKQSCDFVAVWTPSREDTALAYAGFIDDEDAGPEDRAADRAERFGNYADKRAFEAETQADRYDAGPAAHGYQSQARAERAAARHDRTAARAVDRWSKAEYWTERTAGVIRHALYNSSAPVRMGRIKALEADLRKCEKGHIDHTKAEQLRHDSILSIIEHTEGRREKITVPSSYCFRHTLHGLCERDGTPEDTDATTEQICRATIETCLDEYHVREHHTEALEAAKHGTRPALEIAREWIAANPRPEDWNPDSSRYAVHLRLRLAYENQMLEAQGGRAGQQEMEVAGWIGKYQIRKINKSNATGRVVSVTVRCEGTRWGNNPKPGEWFLSQIEVERMAKDAYTPPTEEDKEALAAQIASEKAAAPKAKPVPLVNPTLEEARRIQEVWNQGHARSSYGGEPAPEVAEMTQAQYTACSSSGNYSNAETVAISGGGQKLPSYSNTPQFPAVAKIRKCKNQVVVLTDKPKKKLPAEVWQDPRPEVCRQVMDRAEEMHTLSRKDSTWQLTEEEKDLLNLARLVGLGYRDSQCQFGITQKFKDMEKETPAPETFTLTP
jgi:hypothetical protein